MIHQITSRRYSILERVINFLAKYLLDIQTNHKTVEIFFNGVNSSSRLISILNRPLTHKTTPEIYFRVRALTAMGRGDLQQIIFANVKEVCK